MFFQVATQRMRKSFDDSRAWWLLAHLSFTELHREGLRKWEMSVEFCIMICQNLVSIKKKKKKTHKKHQPSLGVILWYSQDKPVSVNASGWVVGMLPLHYITHRHSVWFMDLRVWKNELFTSLHLNPFLKWNRRYKTFLSGLHLASNLYHGTKTYYDLRCTRPFFDLLTSHNTLLPSCHHGS